MSTAERLLNAGRELFWSRGYTNVPVRQVARAAGVDVALISRHFGCKQGLFVATLEDAFSFPTMTHGSPAELTEACIALFVSTPRGTEDVTPLRMLLRNVDDPEVGGLTRQAFSEQLYQSFSALFASPAQAAMFMSVLLGFSVAEKTLHLPGIADPNDPAFACQLRHLLSAALAYDGPK